MAMSLFRWALKLFPRWFRDAHGEEMQELFEARVARAGSAPRRLSVVRKAVIDIVGSAWAVRRRGAPRTSIQNAPGGGMMGTLTTDLGNTLRRLARAPGFTAGAVLLLAVGIGANATVFSLVDALLFRPPPWADADRVVYIYQDSDDGEPSSTSFPAYRDIAESELFSAVGAATQWSANLGSAEGRTELAVELITSSYMDVLGLSPARGRWFGPEHDRVGSEFAAVVPWSTWTSRFGSDADIVGRTLDINGQPVTIIGVGPRGLSSSTPPFATDLWLSISSTPAVGDYMVENLERRADHWYQVRARLAPGVTVEQSRAAMDGLATRLATSFPEFNQGRDITVFESRSVRSHPQADGALFQAGTLLTAVVTAVLLLACANLANLLLVRGLGRAGEMAVRRAMGASGGRIARLFILESFALAAAGGALGVAFTAWAIRVVPSLPLPDAFPGVLDLRLDGRLLLFSLGLVAATGTLFGSLPALRAARDNVAGVLREDRRTSSLGRGTVRLRNGLIIVQVVASLLLVLTTGMLVRGLTTSRGVDPGVDVERLAWIRVDLGAVATAPEEVRALMDEVMERLGGQPGADGVAATSRLPAQSGGSTTTIVEGYQPAAGTEAIELDFTIVSDDYFSTVGLDLVEGRGFSVDDQPGAATAVVVNETAARRFWGNGRAIGRRLRGQGSQDWHTVVGVVADAPVSTLAEDTPPAFYFTARQTGGIAAPYLVLRTNGDPELLLSTARAEIRATRSSIEVAGQGTMADHIGESLSGARLATTLLGGFSLLAILLAGLGIYAVVSFGVARRSAELGIRMALGAGSQRVVRMVLREVVGTVAVGVIAGLVLAAFITPRIAGLIYGVGGADPFAYGGGVIFILAATGLAAWIPARRAADADPVEALRSS
jgi:predicted permease